MLPRLNFYKVFGSLPPSVRTRVRRAYAVQRVVLNDPAMVGEQETLENLQPAITREMAQLTDEITRLQDPPASPKLHSAKRERRLIRARRKLHLLETDEAELLDAAPAELPSIMDRLLKGHPDLASSPGVTDAEARVLILAKPTELTSEASVARDASKRRELQYARWKERVSHSHEWISFREIAEWCAEFSGIDDWDKEFMNLIAESYWHLGASLAVGDFGIGRHSRVIYPPGAFLDRPPFIRLTPERFAAPPNPEGRSWFDMLELCWLPRDLARGWLEGRLKPLPPWLAAPAIEPAQPQAEPDAKTVPAKGALTHTPGRPNATNTCIELFNARRAANLPMMRLDRGSEGDRCSMA